MPQPDDIERDVARMLADCGISPDTSTHAYGMALARLGRNTLDEIREALLLPALAHKSKCVPLS